VSVVRPFPQRQPEAAAGPCNPDAEAAFLGAALIDGAVLDQLPALPAPEDFAEPVNTRIWGRILECRARGDAVSGATLRPYFEGEELRYLASLAADGQGLLAPRELAEQITGLGARRRRLEWLAREADAARDLDQPLADIAPPEAIRAPAAPLVGLDLAAMALREPEAKLFTLPRIAPAAEVTLFTGAGAVGKSLLAQQFATAIAAGRQTLGLDLDQAPAIYLTCEDDADQLHWRQVHISKALGVGMADLSGVLHLISLRGEPDNALAHFLPDGRLIPAPLFSRLSTLIRSTGARLVALDNVAHLFAGNENDRGQVTAFVNLLNRAAGESGAAILLLGHPNKAGDSYSGSTAWLNAVRSQVSMTRPDAEDGDQDARTLTAGKPNYSRAGEAMRFRWHEWAFVLEDDLPADQRAELAHTIRETSANSAFMRCLEACTKAERAVSHHPGSNYAPNVFAKIPEGKGFDRKAFEGAFERLLSLGEIAVDQPLWKRDNRVWKRGIKAAEKRTNPPALTPRTDPHRPLPESGGNPCTGLHAPTPLYTTYIAGGAEGGPPPSDMEDEGGAHD
jgi:RecA-family ATPase